MHQLRYPATVSLTAVSQIWPTAQSMGHLHRQGGYALTIIIIVLMIIGAVTTGGINLTTKTEQLAGNAIQRSRSFQAAEGAALQAETKIVDMMVSRVFADDTASTGIFSLDKRSEHWWRDESTDGIHETDTNLLLGVVSPPRYVIEQVGVYVSDGGTGVVNLDIGSAAYGRQSSAGRELVLFSVESQGKGSFESVETVVESVVAFSY